MTSDGSRGVCWSLTRLPASLRSGRSAPGRDHGQVYSEDGSDCPPLLGGPWRRLRGLAHAPFDRFTAWLQYGALPHRGNGWSRDRDASTVVFAVAAAQPKARLPGKEPFDAV